jgi:hypothetical protein
MRRFRILLTAITVGALLWISAGAYNAVSRIMADNDASEVAKAFAARGVVLIPAKQSKNLRGDERKDYWCHSDGSCFYPIDRFRWFYPAYNDLEDSILLEEMRRL